MTNLDMIKLIQKKLNYQRRESMISTDKKSITTVPSFERKKSLEKTLLKT